MKNKPNVYDSAIAELENHKQALKILCDRAFESKDSSVSILGCVSFLSVYESQVISNIKLLKSMKEICNSTNESEEK